MKPRFKSRRLLSSAALITVAFTLAPHSQAASYYWDTNGTSTLPTALGNTAGTWGAGVAGSADLVTIASNGLARSFIDGTAAATAANATASGDIIYFGTVNLAMGSTASNIAIDAAGVNISTIVFGQGQGSQGVTLGGGASGNIALGTAANIVSNNTGTNTISTKLLGTAGLTVSGPSTLVLTGANTYTGGTTINAGGTLKVGNGTLGSLTSQNLTFNAGGGTFNVVEAAGSTQAMSILNFAGGEGIVQSTYAGPGNSALTFTSLSTRPAGATGNLVTSGGVNGTTNNIVLTVAATGTKLDKGIFFNGNSYAAYDTGGFVRALNYGVDANTAATDTITASKDVQLTASAGPRVGDTLLSLNLAGGGVDYTMSSGALTIPAILKSGGGTVSTISGGILSNGNAELVIRADTSSDLLTITSQMIGNGALTKSGAGTLTLSNANNTYSGTTTINAGTLAVSGGSSIADGNAVILSNAAGAVFQLESNETIGNLSGGGFSGGDVNVKTSTLTISNAANQKFGGKFIGTGGVVISSNTLTLNNQNTFAGTLTVGNGATLSFAEGNPATGPAAIVSSGGGINLNGGSTLNINPTAQPTLGQLGNQASIFYTVDNNISVATGSAAANITLPGLNDTKFNFSGTVTGSSTAATPTTLAITTPSGNGRQEILFSNVISDGVGGALGITANLNSSTGGSGSWLNLQVANTFTGPISVTNSGTALNWLVIGGERTSISTVTTGTGYIGGGTYTNTISLAASTALEYESSAAQTLGGAISGAGQVIKGGSGTLTLTAANTYAGATTINTGILQIGNGSTTGRLTATSAISNNANLTINRSDPFSQATDLGANVAITGSGSFTQAGSGTTTLTAVNTYNGATTVNAGTLLVSGSIANSAVTVSNSGTILASGATGTIGKTVSMGADTHLAAGGTSAIGTATVAGATTFGTGSIFDWDIATTHDGAQTAGTDYDSVKTTGLAGGSAIFNVVLQGGDSFASTFWDSAHTWDNIFSTAGTSATALPLDALFSTSNFTYNGSATAPTSEGSFSYTNGGTALTWSAVPEPTSALAGLLITAGLLRRRRGVASPHTRNV